MNNNLQGEGKGEDSVEGGSKREGERQIQRDRADRGERERETGRVKRYPPPPLLPVSQASFSFQ